MFNFTHTENHENFAADAAQWAAESAMSADAAREQAREEGAEAIAEARREWESALWCRRSRTALPAAIAAKILAAPFPLK
jgi:hypothetical protein